MGKLREKGRHLKLQDKSVVLRAWLSPTHRAHETLLELAENLK